MAMVLSLSLPGAVMVGLLVPSYHGGSSLMEVLCGSSTWTSPLSWRSRLCRVSLMEMSPCSWSCRSSTCCRVLSCSCRGPSLFSRQRLMRGSSICGRPCVGHPHAFGSSTSIVRVIHIDGFNCRVSMQRAPESAFPHNIHQSLPVSVWGSWGSRQEWSSWSVCGSSASSASRRSSCG
jgi:hypothetical protein